MKKRFLLLALIAVLALSFATVLSACNKQEETGPVKIEAPKDFDYDGTYITWADANGAATYEIVVNEGEPVTSKSSTFKFKATEDKFTVSVTAKAAEGSEEYLDSDTVTKIFDKIAAVENVEFADDATMTWNTVSGATGYVVEYNGTKTKVTDCVFAQLPAGKYSVKVKAIRDSEPNYVYYTENPVSTNITVLESVVSDRITFDGTTIKWNAISGAINYQVFIDDSDKGLVSTNSMIFDAEGQSFNVKVLAVGDKERKIFNASEKGDRNFIYLAPATNLSMDDGVLTWDAVKDAEGYEIKIRNKGTQKVTEPKFDGFTPGESTSLQIRAFTSDNTYFAGWTDETTYLLLKAPVLQWDDKRLNGSEAEPVFWDQVPNATGYLAVIDGPEGYKKQDNLGVDGVGYGSDFLKAGTYTVKVKSLADKNNACDSKWSEPITVVRLASPKLDAGAPITSTPDDLTKGFTVTFVNVPEATDYKLYKNGISVKLSGGRTQITEYMNETGNEGDTASFVLQSIGRSYSSRDKKVVLDSLYTESESFPITVLATPSIDVEPITGMTYNFGKVSGTSKYTIKLDGEYEPIDDGDDGYDLSKLKGGKNYNISVNARGDGKSTLSSKYTAETQISRLSAPTNVKINTENGSAGNLYFDSILNAQSYEYTIDGVKYVLEKDQIDNIANKIGTDTKLFMRSIGNYYKNKIYYMDSPNSETYSFTKLPTPDVSPNNALKGTKLIWSKISDFGQYSPSYRVVNSKNIVVGRNIDVGELELDKLLPAGETETYYIYAIGNGTKYINSDTPVQGITITRLLKPEVTIDLEEKAYSWDLVPQAKEYQVYVDGILKETLTNSSNQDKYYYRPGFTQSKTYNVQITAIGNNGDGLMDSPKFEKLQQTKVLSTPTFTYSYDKEIVSNDGNIVVNVTSSTEGVLGYAFVVKGNERRQMLHYYGSENDFSLEDLVKYTFNAQSSGAYSIDVYALGGNFVYDSNTGEYVATLNSADSGGVYSIYLLAYPNGIEVDGFGFLTWNSVPNAKSYIVSLTVDDQEYFAPTTTNSLNMKSYLKDQGVTYNAGNTNVTIKIQAINTNSDYVNSDWSPAQQW